MNTLAKIFLIIVAASKIMALDMSISGEESSSIQITYSKNGGQISVVLEPDGDVYYLDKDMRRVGINASKADWDRGRNGIFKIASSYKIIDGGEGGPGFKMVSVQIGTLHGGIFISYGWNAQNGEMVPEEAQKLVQIAEDLIGLNE